MPDLLLYNSADDSFSVGATVNAVIYSSGDVSYLPPGMFKSTCIIKIDDFPFDEQICKLKVMIDFIKIKKIFCENYYLIKFGSWTYDESAINLQNKSSTGQVDSYIKNGEWFLKGELNFSKCILFFLINVYKQQYFSYE